MRPIHDALMTAVGRFGGDIEIAPKKGYSASADESSSA